MEKTAPKYMLPVDGQKGFLASLADSLNACDGNFCILTAENGDRLLQVLASNPVDMVVTDLMMPLMDGFVLLSHLDVPFALQRITFRMGIPRRSGGGSPVSNV